MEPTPSRRKRFPKWTLVPVLLAALVAPFGGPMTVCACIDQLGTLVGREKPDELTVAEIEQRILQKFPVGTTRKQFEMAPATAGGKECVFSQIAPQIDCTYVRVRSLYGLEERGVSVTFGLDPSDRLLTVKASRFDRYVWSRP
jgi:hypothetical protein